MRRGGSMRRGGQGDFGRPRRCGVDNDRLSRLPMARFGRRLARAGHSAPYRDRLAAILRIAGKTRAQGDGPIATALVEFVEEGSNAARQIAHEGRRGVLAMLLASKLFAAELTEKPFDLPPTPVPLIARLIA